MSKTPKHKSARADGRGGWPTGKRRNVDAGDWTELRIALQAWLNEHYELEICSNRVVAAACGVNDRSVRRWLDGTDRPPVEAQEAIRTWLAEQRQRHAGKK